MDYQDKLTSTIWAADRHVHRAIKDAIDTGLWTASIHGTQTKLVFKRTSQILWVNRTFANETYIRKLRDDIDKIANPPKRAAPPKKAKSVVKRDKTLTVRSDNKPFHLLHPHDCEDYIAPDDFDVMIDLITKQDQVPDLVVKQHATLPNRYDIGYWTLRTTDEMKTVHDFKVVARNMSYADANLWKLMRQGFLSAMVKYIVTLQTKHEEVVRRVKIWETEATESDGVEAVGVSRLHKLGHELEHWLTPLREDQPQVHAAE